mmetsp:Transcript_27351/g.68994  ORF Transcript_27351/g.68994 Transcript_27351/m.68994 type:complete len:114 (-) Transcript_27351:80-421(-)
MVYIGNLESFVEAGQQLFISSPGKTRYLVKYRHVDAKLVLKVTDDKVCLKYRTDRQDDLKRIGRLNAFFMRLMCAETVNAETAQAIEALVQEEDMMQVAPTAVPHSGGKKKKK